MVSEINNVQIERYLTVPYIDLRRESVEKSFFQSLFTSGSYTQFLRPVEMEAFIPLHLLDFVSTVRQEYHTSGSSVYDLKTTHFFTFVISLSQETKSSSVGIRLNDAKNTEKQSLKLYFRDQSICEQFNNLLHAHCRGVRLMEKVSIGREVQLFFCQKIADQLYEAPENEKGFLKTQLIQYADFTVDGFKVEKMRTTLHRTLELIHKVEETYTLKETSEGVFKFVMKEIE